MKLSTIVYTVVVVGIIGAIYVAVDANQDTTLQDVKEETKEAFETTKAYVADEQRDEIASISNELATLEKQLEQFQKRAEAEVSEEFNQALKNIDEKQQEAIGFLEAVQADPTGATTTNRDDLDRALNELRADYQALLEKYPKETNNAASAKQSMQDTSKSSAQEQVTEQPS